MASAINIVPTAVILAAAMSCAWPYLGATESETTTVAVTPSAKAKADLKGKEKSTELGATLLNPVLPPKPARNPFEDHEVLRIEAHAMISKRIKEIMDARVKAINQEKLKPLTLRSAKTANGTSQAIHKVASNPLEGLVLNGTSFGSTRGAAVINGKAYTSGDQIDAHGATGPCVLGEVCKGYVVLHHNGEKHTLSYPLLGGITSSKRPVKAAGAAAGATKGRR